MNTAAATASPIELLGRIVLARPVGQKRRQRILVTNTYAADNLLTGLLVKRDGLNYRGGAAAYLSDVEAVEPR